MFPWSVLLPSWFCKLCLVFRCLLGHGFGMWQLMQYYVCGIILTVATARWIWSLVILTVKCFTYHISFWCGVSAPDAPPELGASARFVYLYHCPLFWANLEYSTLSASVATYRSAIAIFLLAADSRFYMASLEFSELLSRWAPLFAAVASQKGERGQLIMAALVITVCCMGARACECNL